MKLAHVSITARDASALAAFYAKVFGCREIRPPRSLAGMAVSRGNGLPETEILSIWLSLPGAGEVFLEILEYSIQQDRAPPAVNQPGLAHLSFAVENIRRTHAAVLETGGAAIGRITDLGTVNSPFWAVYMRDPEGNILELEQG